MHHSRLVGFIIDCGTGDLDAGAKFWSQALGRELEPPSEDQPTYRGLVMRDNEPILMLQKVDHPSRVHLDIEADDVEAEVARLEKLGARRVHQIRTWWVMEAPTGHRFCVVRPQTKRLAGEGNEWPG